MREIYRAGVTPQEKLVAVNNKFGNSGIQSQQGTSRIIYDSLLITSGKTYFRFFEDSTTRAFPLTNTGSEGNKLGVGDTMIVAQVLFTIWYRDTASGIWVYNSNLLNEVGSPLGYFDFDIANNKVIKKLTLSEAINWYNKETMPVANTIDLETQIVIPPLLPYTLDLQLAIPPSVVTTPEKEYYLVCQIIGTGGIIAPRTTF